MKDNALYLEADEDITSAIDKLSKSPAASVQIVVPKRSTMLQSIINLKLLKKAAESHGKELVLVTSDRIATDLAARVGLPVAASLGGKPVLTEAEMPADLNDTDEIIDEDDPEPPTPAPEPKPPKSKAPFLKHKAVSDGPPAPPEPELPDVSELDAPAAAAGVAEKPSPKAKKAPKVPNWGRLQRRALWIGAAVILIGGYTLGMYLFTSAKVTLYANGTKTGIDTTFTVDPTLKASDQTKGVLAGQLVTVAKDLSGPFTPTGQKDAGTKANGTITISNCLDNSTHTFVSGTRFQAPDGKIFRSTADVDVPGGHGSFFGCNSPGTATVQVQADQNGDSYNEAAATYSMPGLSDNEQSGQNSISAKGSQMSGGTSKQVTVVQQSDVDGAKTDLLSKDKDASGRDLNGRVPTGYTAISASQNSTVSNVSPAPAVNAEGSTGNLSLHVVYTVLAVKTSDYQALVEAKEAAQLGNGNQVYDNGISSAQISANGSPDATGRQGFHFTTDAFGGPKLDTSSIAQQLAGKRFGDAQDTANRTPGVTKADITLTPPWATNLPSRTSAVHVSIKVANQ